MRLNLERVRANVRQAETEDLLDRATVYRAGMEPEALAIIEDELRARGVSEARIAAHGESRLASALVAPEGSAVQCCRCHRPATGRHWSWGYLWGLVPLFPRRLAFCDAHRPK